MTRPVTTTAAPAADDDVSVPANPPTSAYRYLVLFLLTGVYTFNFLDRQIMGILAPAIQAEFALSDSQLGFLSGIAFAILYTTLGIPIARLADRHNRVTIIAVSLAVWSGFTALCGLAANFWQLAAARIGVGIGEAGGTPPAHALISDYFPKEARAGALAIYSMGIPIGITIAYLGGGWIVQNFDWRTAFLGLGIPGVLLAVILRLIVREPERGLSDRIAATKKGEPLPAKPTTPDGALFEIGALWRAAGQLLRIPTYANMLTAQTAVSFASYATSAFTVLFFLRSHPDFDKLAVYGWLGVINGTAYVAGVFAGGRFVDKFAAKDKTAYGSVPAWAMILYIPFFIGAIWVGSPVWCLILLWPVHFLVGIHLGPGFALAQTLAPVHMRALSTAIYFFVLNLIALGLGPSITGVLSDLFAGMPNVTADIGLRLAMTTTLVPVIIGIFAFWRVTKTVVRDWEIAAKRHHEPKTAD
ncbi:MAG: MFS transporter [Pseudomonadota bacterium]